MAERLTSRGTGLCTVQKAASAGQDGQAGRGGQEAAGGTAGGPAAACGGDPPGQPGHDVERSGDRQEDQRGADRVDRGRRVVVAADRGGHEVGLHARRSATAPG